MPAGLDTPMFRDRQDQADHDHLYSTGQYAAAAEMVAAEKAKNGDGPRPVGALTDEGQSKLDNAVPGVAGKDIADHAIHTAMSISPGKIGAGLREAGGQIADHSREVNENALDGMMEDNSKGFFGNLFGMDQDLSHGGNIGIGDVPNSHLLPPGYRPGDTRPDGTTVGDEPTLPEAGLTPPGAADGLDNEAHDIPWLDPTDAYNKQDSTRGDPGTGSVLTTDSPGETNVDAAQPNKAVEDMKSGGIAAVKKGWAGYSQEKKDNIWASLISFGSTMMTTPGNFGMGLGKGFEAGLQTYNELDEEDFDQMITLRDQERADQKMAQDERAAGLAHDVAQARLSITQIELAKAKQGDSPTVVMKREKDYLQAKFERDYLLRNGRPWVKPSSAATSKHAMFYERLNEIVVGDPERGIPPVPYDEAISIIDREFDAMGSAEAKPDPYAIPTQPGVDSVPIREGA